jgi:hypothetical protein
MLLEEIDRQVKNRSLTGEDGNRFKRAVVTNTLGLFKDGALIQDIPLTEQVDNEKLLNSFGPKLLAAPERPDGPTRTSPVPAPAADLPKAEAPSRKRRSVRARRSIPKASEVG